MHGKLFLLSGVVSLGASVLLAQPRPKAGAAESFGLGDQTLHIGASGFHPTDSSAQYFVSEADGYAYRADGYPRLIAPLTLPEGAEIRRMCLYAFDGNPDPAQGVAVSLEVVRLVSQGEAPLIESVHSVSPPLDFEEGYGELSGGRSAE